MTGNNRQPRYQRIVLKLSGEALSRKEGMGISIEEAQHIARRVKDVHDLGVEIVVVIGAGNLWRGKDGLQYGMDHATADYMGMIGTVMNALALQDALERLEVVTRVQTAIDMREVAEPYIRLRAIRHLEKGRVVIMAAGTGNPFFTTDTAAALRGVEVGADVLIKATKVDGVYDSDPNTNPNAQRFERVTYMDALSKQLGVMDAAAFSLCMQNDLPIIVLNLWEGDSLTRAILGESVGTMVSQPLQ